MDQIKHLIEQTGVHEWDGTGTTAGSKLVTASERPRAITSPVRANTKGERARTPVSCAGGSMDQQFKYPWQKAVADAFMAPPDSLVVKINVAEKGISARLTDSNPIDHEERLALSDAMRALKVIMREAEARTKPAQPQEKDIA